MGGQGTEARFPGDLVLDAGALIAFERGDRAVAALLKRSSAMGSQAVVPATALAQAWRGGPRSARLSRLLESIDVDPLGEERAKEVGVRLGVRRGSDVTDSHVVCCAVELCAAVATSDPDDIRALADSGEGLALIAC